MKLALTICLLVTSVGSSALGANTSHKRKTAATYSAAAHQIKYKRKAPSVFQRVIVLGGINGSEMQGYNAEQARLEIRPRIGPQMNITTDIGWSYFAIETGLQYRSMGFIGTEDVLLRGEWQTIDVEFNYNYLSVPVLAKFYFTRSRVEHTGYAKIGLVYSHLLPNQNYRVKSSSGSEFTGSDMQGLHRSELGAQAGLGGRFDLGAEIELFVEGGYYRGITRMVENGEYYNAGFTAGAGVGFRL